jgi:acyl carrier protein
MGTMSNSDIEREIRTFLINNFLFGRAEALSDNAALLGGVIDSTGAIELVVFLQDKFGISIEDEEIAVPENFDSVANLVTFVETKLRNSTTPAGNLG